jgi:hypothetical protein
MAWVKGGLARQKPDRRGAAGLDRSGQAVLLEAVVQGSRRDQAGGLHFLVSWRPGGM